jgi:hypothetical protein
MFSGQAAALQLTLNRHYRFANDDDGSFLAPNL